MNNDDKRLVRNAQFGIVAVVLGVPALLYAFGFTFFTGAVTAFAFFCLSVCILIAETVA